MRRIPGQPDSSASGDAQVRWPSMMTVCRSGRRRTCPRPGRARHRPVVQGDVQVLQERAGGRDDVHAVVRHAELAQVVVQVISRICARQHGSGGCSGRPEVRVRVVRGSQAAPVVQVAVGGGVRQGRSSRRWSSRYSAAAASQEKIQSGEVQVVDILHRVGPHGLEVSSEWHEGVADADKELL